MRQSSCWLKSKHEADGKRLGARGLVLIAPRSMPLAPGSLLWLVQEDMMNRKHVIGVDIGGTKIATGLVAPGAEVVERIVLPTRADQSGEIVLQQIFKTIDTMIEAAKRRSDEIAAIGIVAPGPLSPGTGELFYAPNIPNLRNIPIAGLVRDRYHLPCLIENDANAAGLAEALFGAGIGYKYVFYVTVSTGIGTGVVIDGHIYSGKNGMAAEAGHVTIDYQGPVCNCGQRGCIEAFASGTAITRRTKEKLIADRGLRIAESAGESAIQCQAKPVWRTHSAILGLVDGDVDKITPIIVAQAAREGDQLAQRIIIETGEYLSIWLGGMINSFDPDIIVIGGGISLIGDLLFNVVREQTPKHSIIPKAADVLIVPAKLQKDVGILGAAALFASMRQ
jgi:glucokinase